MNKMTVLCLITVFFLLAGCGPRTTQKNTEITELRQRTAEQERELNRSRQEIAKLENRLEAMEEKLIADDDSIPLQKKTGVVQQKNTGSENTPEKKGSSGTKEPAASASDPSDLAVYEYKKALELVRVENKYSRARKSFEEFLARYPGHELEPNALYWLGETYYVQKQFGEAILTLKKVPARYPGHSKAPDALLKIGYAYEFLGDLDNARFYLTTLVSEYPTSQSADLARKRLEDFSS